MSNWPAGWWLGADQLPASVLLVLAAEIGRVPPPGPLRSRFALPEARWPQPVVWSPNKGPAE